MCFGAAIVALNDYVHKPKQLYRNSLVVIEINDTRMPRVISNHSHDVESFLNTCSNGTFSRLTALYHGSVLTLFAQLYDDLLNQSRRAAAPLADVSTIEAAS